MDDLEACARLCADRDFRRPAALLHALADPSPTAFAVLEHEFYVYSEDVEPTYPPRARFLPIVAVHLDRESARDDAAARIARKLREPIEFTTWNLEGFCHEYVGMEPDAFVAAVGEILGEPYRPVDLIGSPERRYHTRIFRTNELFPQTATDDQMRAIARLLTGRQPGRQLEDGEAGFLYSVAEVKLAEPSPAATPA